MPKGLQPTTRNGAAHEAPAEMQSDPWILSNPRAACQEGAPVRLRCRRGARNVAAAGLPSTARKRPTFLPTMLPDHAFVRRAGSSSTPFELRKGASRPLSYLDVVIEMKLVRVGAEGDGVYFALTFVAHPFFDQVV